MFSVYTVHCTVVHVIMFLFQTALIQVAVPTPQLIISFRLPFLLSLLLAQQAEDLKVSD